MSINKRRLFRGVRYLVCYNFILSKDVTITTLGQYTVYCRSTRHVFQRLASGEECGMKMLNAVSDWVSYSYMWFSFPQNEKREDGRIYQNGLLSLVMRHVLHSNNWHTSSCWSLLQKRRRTLPNKQRNYKKRTCRVQHYDVKRLSMAWYSVISVMHY